MARLKREFFLQPTLKVSRDLLGKFLVHEYRGKKISGMIVETEAYIGPRDRASHAFGGKVTERNKAEYFIGGHVYIYLVYGMYWQLNFSTCYHGEPECVLIRALEPTDKLHNLTSGPGKLCAALKLDKSFYGYDVCQKSAKLYVEDRGLKISPRRIAKGPRIGIGYAGPYWSKIHWRFWIKDNPFVSK